MKNKIFCLLVLSTFLLNVCSTSYAIPVPVYGNTYEVTEVPANAESAKDFNISTAIRRQIAANPALLKSNPRVYCQNGVVTFEGKVTGIGQAQQLVDIAVSIPDVTDIIITNLFDMSGNHIPQEITVPARVKLLIVKNQIFGNTPANSLPVSVTTASVVYLTGTVVSKEQAESIIAITKSVSGVGGVYSDLRVSR